VRWLDRLPYAKGLALQERLVTARRNGEAPDTLLLLEHPPVITLGRAADPDHVVADEQELARRGIEVHDCGRGGDVTFHGPGQLIGYPIVRLGEERRDAHRYLRDLEQALIDTVAVLGVEASRVPESGSETRSWPRSAFASPRAGSRRTASLSTSVRTCPPSRRSCPAAFAAGA
jgi:lipoate-protein ligase B